MLSNQHTGHSVPSYVSTRRSNTDSAPERNLLALDPPRAILQGMTTVTERLLHETSAEDEV
jgi:hypothetical protein